MLIAMRQSVRHPFYSALKPAPAIETKGDCHALCGPFDELALAASAGARPRRAVFAICPPSQPFLTDQDREALWGWFEVPVYAVVTDPRRRVIGYECEAQDGLHLAEDYTGPLAGAIESRACDCGRPGRRLM